MAITDLTNTTWVVPAGWSATSYYGAFHLTGTISGVAYDGSKASADTEHELDSYEIDSFAIGYYVDYPGDLYSRDNCIAISPNYYSYYFKSTEGFTLNITGGEDATNSALISWLETYSEKPTPTDAVIVEYNNAVIATLTEGKVTLSCKDKQMHTNVVITVSEFGGEEILEWDGSYTIGGGVELISFTVDGDHYEAEDGMTWGEWIESEYNTGSITTDGGDIVILATSSTTGYMIKSANGTAYTYDVIVADTAYTKGRSYDFGS